MEFICNFCKNKFSSNISLKNHQKNTIYCLQKQGKNIDTYNCQNCQKNFQHKKSLTTHLEKCNRENESKTKEIIIQELQNTLEREKLLKRQIEKYESIIQDLANKLENIAIKGATKPTNTNIIKLECLTRNHMEDCAKLITDNDILNYDNLAKFAVENSFTDLK